MRAGPRLETRTSDFPGVHLVFPNSVNVMGIMGQHIHLLNYLENFKVRLRQRVNGLAI